MSMPVERNSAPTFPRDAEQTQLDIELTREELGDTIQELMHKLNVPARARQQAEHAVHNLRRKLPRPVATGVVGLGGVVRRYPLLALGLLVLALIGVVKYRRGTR